MNSFVYNNEFDKDVIIDKLSKISEELEEEYSKDKSERNIEKERELIYAQMIEGLKLNTLRPNKNLYF